MNRWSGRTLGQYRSLWFVFFFAVTWTAACGTDDVTGPDAPSRPPDAPSRPPDAPSPPPRVNHAPIAEKAIPEREITQGQTISIVASAVFSDPDGDVLVFEARSQNPSVATTSVLSDTVQVSGAGPGNTQIRIVARDPGGLTAVRQFRVTVESDEGDTTDEAPGAVRHQRIAMFIIDFPDNEEDADFPTPEEIEMSLEGGIVSEFFDVISHNKFTYEIDAYGPFTYQNSFPSLLPDHTRKMTDVNGLKMPRHPSQYDIFLLVTLSDYTFEGAVATNMTHGLKINNISYPSHKSLIVLPLFKGCRNRNCDTGRYQDVFTQADSFSDVFTLFQRIFAHELLHAIGIWTHAQSRTNGSRFHYEPEVPNNGKNLRRQYGNFFDILGSPQYGFNLNVGYRDLLGWLDPSRKIVISTPGFHVATINPINSAQGVTAVEIRIPHLSESYYLEVRDFMDQWDYRNLFSFSADVMSDNSEGIMVYRTLTQTGRTTYLLDMSPTANYADYVEDIYNSGPGVADIRDVVLKEGMVYSSADVNLYNVSPGPDMNSFTVSIFVKSSSETGSFGSGGDPDQ